MKKVKSRIKTGHLKYVVSEMQTSLELKMFVELKIRAKTTLGENFISVLKITHSFVRVYASETTSPSYVVTIVTA